MTESEHDAYVALLSEVLGEARYWEPVEDHINESLDLCLRRSEALRRASNGDMQAWREAEALAIEARDAVAEKIIAAHLKTRRPPYAPPRLLAKFPTGNVPAEEIYNFNSMELAA